MLGQLREKGPSREDRKDHSMGLPYTMFLYEKGLKCLVFLYITFCVRIIIKIDIIKKSMLLHGLILC